MRLQRRKVTLLAAGLLCLSSRALACSPGPGWKRPTPVDAFNKSRLVVHGVVESVREDMSGFVAKLKDLRILKGQDLPEAEVRTLDGAGCGIGKFTVGKEYVLFLLSAQHGVHALSQPGGAPEATLEALRKAALID